MTTNDRTEILSLFFFYCTIIIYFYSVSLYPLVLADSDFWGLEFIYFSYLHPTSFVAFALVIVVRLHNTQVKGLWFQVFFLTSVMIGSWFSSDWGGDLESSFTSQSDVYRGYFDGATIDVLSPCWVASWYICIFMSWLAHLKIGSQWAEVFLWRGWSSRGSHSDDVLTISWRALIFQTQVVCKLKLFRNTLLVC